MKSIFLNPIYTAETNGWACGGILVLANFHFRQGRAEFCRVNGVSLPCLADAVFGYFLYSFLLFCMTSPEVALSEKKIGEATVKSNTLLFWWSV